MLLVLIVFLVLGWLVMQLLTLLVRRVWAGQLARPQESRDVHLAVKAPHVTSFDDDRLHASIPLDLCVRAGQFLTRHEVIALAQNGPARDGHCPQRA